VGASSLVRGLLVAGGCLLLLAGFTGVSLGGEFAGAGLWLVITGGFLIIAAVLERHRYRSESADRGNDPIGPGGGEPPGTLEGRFQPTAEVFVDPTTGTRMRVLVDPRTGERRYVAEASS
jgi:hypothetical protein